MKWYHDESLLRVRFAEVPSFSGVTWRCPSAGILIVIMMAGFLCSSCGSGITAVTEEMEKDSGFGFDRLKGSGIVVVGVTARGGTVTGEDRLDLSAAMASLLQESLPTDARITCVSPEILAARMGEEPYEAFMLQCDNEGMLTSEDLKKLTLLSPGGRYVLLMDLLTDATSNRSSTSWVSDEQSENYETVYEEERYVRVDFQLYDTAAEKMVWRSLIVDRKVDSQQVNSGESFGDVLVTGIIYAIFGSPADVELDEVFAGVVEHCAEDLRNARAEIP